MFVGRYRCISYAIRVSWVGTIALNTYFIVENYVKEPPHTADVVIQVLLNGIIGIGLAGLLVNCMLMGLDQLMDASSTNITSVISWLVSLNYLTCVLASLFQLDLCKEIYAFSVPFCSVSFLMTVLIVSDCCFNHWLIKEPVTQNPLKLIYQVLKYAVKNKYPRLRSAFTYWEDKPFSRMDLGKRKYGGPFTTEQVEDVKTFFRILAILCAATLLMGFISKQYSVESQLLLHYQDHSFVECTDSNLSTYLRSNLRRFIVQNFSYIVVVSLVTLLFVFHPVIKKWTYYFEMSSVLKMKIGIAMLMLSEMVHLSMEITNMYIGNNQNCTCFFYSSAEDVLNDNVIPVDFKWLLIPQGLLGVSLYFFATSGAQFIVAQTPYSMRGLLLGSTCFFYGTGTSYISTILSSSISSLLKDKIKNERNCAVWYFVASIGMCLFLIIASLITRKLYCPRRRDEDVHNQQIFAVNYYEKYLQSVSDQD